MWAEAIRRKNEQKQTMINNMMIKNEKQQKALDERRKEAEFVD